MEVSQAGCKKRLSSKTSFNIFLPVLPVGNPSRVSGNLDLRCVLLLGFHLRPLETLLRPVFLDRGLSPAYLKASVSISPSLLFKKKLTGRISFQCGGFSYRSSGTLDGFPSNGLISFKYGGENLQNLSHWSGFFKCYVKPYIFFLVRKSWLDF